MKPTELEKIKKILETYIWHNGNSWDYEKATKELLSLLEAREKEAVEGFARWWNVHGGKGEEFITRNSWREYKEHLTQIKGDK